MAPSIPAKELSVTVFATPTFLVSNVEAMETLSPPIRPPRVAFTVAVVVPSKTFFSAVISARVKTF